MIRALLLTIVVALGSRFADTLPQGNTARPDIEYSSDSYFKAQGAPIPPSNFTNVPSDFPFGIEGCGAYTELLKSTLVLASGAVSAALKDMELGTKSPLFKALFKEGASQAAVRHILEGVAYAIRLHDLEPYPRTYSKPTFMCVGPTTGSPFKYLDGMDLYADCVTAGLGTAFYVFGGKYIFLCPAFWAGPVAPESSHCPSVFGNQWPYTADYVGAYLTYSLIHELSHFYLGWESLGLHTIPHETYPINDCVALSPDMSSRNPQNYQYYVALTQQGCRQAPDPNRPPFALLSNSTLRATTLSASSNVSYLVSEA